MLNMPRTMRQLHLTPVRLAVLIACLLVAAAVSLMGPVPTESQVNSHIHSCATDEQNEQDAQAYLSAASGIESPNQWTRVGPPPSVPPVGDNRSYMVVSTSTATPVCCA